MSEGTVERRVVVPGELLGEGESKAGAGVYKDKGDGKLYAARLGVLKERSGRFSVVPLSGVYNPVKDDLVIGIVAELGPSNWLMDINGVYPAPLHVNEVPWRVEFGETARYLAHGDAVLLRVLFVDETRNVQVSMKDRSLKKLTGGRLIKVEPTKVPRIIGKSGSMIETIKKYTGVEVFVGQNGRVWLDGKEESIDVAIEAIRKIEREAHTTGLTARMAEWLGERATVEAPKKAPEAGDENAKKAAAPVKDEAGQK